MRVLPRLRVEGSARVQRRAGSYDALGGGGAVWRVNRSTNLDARVVGGSGNTSLPTADLTAAVVNYAGVFEAGASIRRLSFPDVGVIAASPLLAWDAGGRWRLDARYTYSRSSFDATGESSGDHSVLLRDTWRGWRRVDVNVAYAYGIESFENLTADRLEALGATTIAAGLRIRVPSLTFVATTWEHQWRSNDTTARPAHAVDRAVISMSGLLLEFDRLAPLMVWAAVVFALTMAAAVVVERAAFGLQQALSRHVTQHYGPLVQRALEGDETARRELLASPARHRLAIAWLLIAPLIEDRDPERIANTRAIAQAMSVLTLADRYLRSRRWWRRALALRALGLDSSQGPYPSAHRRAR